MYVNGFRQSALCKERQMRFFTRMILSATCISLLIPWILFWIDITFVVDVPVFCGQIYPYIGLPICSFISSIYLGRIDCHSLNYPVLLFLFYLPNIFILFNTTAFFHCFMAAVPALIGVLIGSKYRKE